MPLGLLLLERGIVDDQQLRDAIAMQQKTGQRIGACLRSTGALKEEDIVSGLSAQWACPVFPARSVQRGCASLVPAAVLRRNEMLPVHITAASRNLYVAFAHAVNYKALYALEQMLDCHTEPCVVSDRVVFDEIERRGLTCENERALEYPDSSTEAAHITVCYARQCGAEEVRYVAADRDLWVRVIGRRGFMDITFQRE
jgi:type IV pilus assembly protein PilB